MADLTRYFPLLCALVSQKETRDFNWGRVATDMGMNKGAVHQQWNRFRTELRDKGEVPAAPGRRRSAKASAPMKKARRGHHPAEEEDDAAGVAVEDEEGEEASEEKLLKKIDTEATGSDEEDRHRLSDAEVRENHLGMNVDEDIEDGIMVEDESSWYHGGSSQSSNEI